MINFILDAIAFVVMTTLKLALLVLCAFAVIPLTVRYLALLAEGAPSHGKAVIH